jgi:hypothetical protein
MPENNNSNAADPNEDLDNFIKKMNADHLTAIKSLKELHILGHGLGQHEIKRLRRNLGKKHPRVRSMKERLKQNFNLVQDLEVELEVAKTRAPELKEHGALIHGRIFDENNRGMAGLTVYMENEKGTPLRYLGRAESDTSGYYALPIEAAVLERLVTEEKEGVYLVIRIREDRILHRESKPLIPAAGDRIIKNIGLKRTDVMPIEKEEKPTDKEQPTPSRDKWGVRGKVFDRETKRGIGRLTISLYDKEKRFDDVLGSTGTDRQGQFEIIHSTRDFRALFRAKPNLFLKVLYKERIISAPKRKVKYKAGHMDYFDIPIDRNRLETR